MKDKKKLAVMIVLGIAVLTVGAFQFVNMSSSEPPKTAAKAKPKAAEEIVQEEGTSQPESTVADLYTLGMNPRDPFQEGALPLADGAMPPPTPQNSNPEPSRPNRPHKSGGGYHIPPPLQGEDWGPLPPNGPGTSLQPSKPIRNPGEFAFSVTGVITGARPAAVFVDDAGNQRLVTVGGSLDGDSRLVSVEKGKVTVIHKGKTQTLNVGGTPNVK